MSTTLTPEQLVDAAYAAHADKLAAEARLDEISAALIKLGRGDYAGTDPSHVAKVIVPAAPEPGYKLEAKNEAEARKIAGPQFGKVFGRKVTFAPCKAFGDVVAKLLTPAKAEKLEALCRVVRETQSPYVKFA